MNKNVKIAKELIRIAKRLIISQRYPFPEAKSYHNNEGDFDATISSKDVSELNYKLNRETRKHGIPKKDYIEVLKNLEELFKQATYLTTPTQTEENKTKHPNDAFIRKLYGTVATINGTTYKIHFTVFFPKDQSDKNYQKNSKIKLYYLNMKEV